MSKWVAKKDDAGVNGTVRPADRLISGSAAGLAGWSGGCGAIGAGGAFAAPVEAGKTRMEMRQKAGEMRRQIRLAAQEARGEPSRPARKSAEDGVVLPTSGPVGAPVANGGMLAPSVEALLNGGGGSHFDDNGSGARGGRKGEKAKDRKSHNGEYQESWEEGEQYWGEWSANDWKNDEWHSWQTKDWSYSQAVPQEFWNTSEDIWQSDWNWGDENVWDEEASEWDEYITVKDNLVRVQLNGAELGDADLKELVQYLDGYMTRVTEKTHGQYVLNMDLSRNSYITDSGVATHLVSFLQKWPVCQRLKLYKNAIGDQTLKALSSWVADGHVHELHLSDLLGKVTGEAVLHLLKEIHRKQNYPFVNGGRQKTPLWLRLEHNGISDVDGLLAKAEALGISTAVVEKADLNRMRPGSGSKGNKNDPTVAINLVLFRHQGGNLQDDEDEETSKGKGKGNGKADHGKNGKASYHDDSQDKGKGKGDKHSDGGKGNGKPARPLTAEDLQMGAASYRGKAPGAQGAPPNYAAWSAPKAKSGKIDIGSAALFPSLGGQEKVESNPAPGAGWGASNLQAAVAWGSAPTAVFAAPKPKPKPKPVLPAPGTVTAPASVPASAPASAPPAPPITTEDVHPVAPSEAPEVPKSEDKPKQAEKSSKPPNMGAAPSSAPPAPPAPPPTLPSPVGAPDALPARQLSAGPVITFNGQPLTEQAEARPPPKPKPPQAAPVGPAPGEPAPKLPPAASSEPAGADQWEAKYGSPKAKPPQYMPKLGPAPLGPAPTSPGSAEKAAQSPPTAPPALPAPPSAPPSAPAAEAQEVSKATTAPKAKAPQYTPSLGPPPSAPPKAVPPGAPPTGAPRGPPTSAPPTSAPPTSAPPTSAPPTSAPPTSAPSAPPSAPPTMAPTAAAPGSSKAPAAPIEEAPSRPQEPLPDFFAIYNEEPEDIVFKPLSFSEKNILKARKKIREVEKIEEAIAANSKVDPGQLAKVQRKAALEQELRTLESRSRSQGGRTLQELEKAEQWRKTHERYENAAIALQRVIRGTQARASLPGPEDRAKVLKEIQEKRETRSAVVVQQVARGMLARRQVQIERDRQAAEAEAARQAAAKAEAARMAAEKAKAEAAAREAEEAKAKKEAEAAAAAAAAEAAAAAAAAAAAEAAKEVPESWESVPDTAEPPAQPPQPEGFRLPPPGTVTKTTAEDPHKMNGKAAEAPPASPALAPVAPAPVAPAAPGDGQASAFAKFFKRVSIEPAEPAKEPPPEPEPAKESRPVPEAKAVPTRLVAKAPPSAPAPAPPPTPPSAPAPAPPPTPPSAPAPAPSAAPPSAPAPAPPAAPAPAEAAPRTPVTAEVNAFSKFLKRVGTTPDEVLVSQPEAAPSPAPSPPPPSPPKAPQPSPPSQPPSTPASPAIGPASTPASPALAPAEAGAFAKFFQRIGGIPAEVEAEEAPVPEEEKPPAKAVPVAESKESPEKEAVWPDPKKSRESSKSEDEVKSKAPPPAAPAPVRKQSQDLEAPMKSTKSDKVDKDVKDTKEEKEKDQKDEDEEDDENAEKVLVSSSLDPRFVGLVIGKAGETIKSFKKQSGASIEIDQNLPPGMPRAVIYRGTKKQVAVARKLVDQLVLRAKDEEKIKNGAGPGMGIMGRGPAGSDGNIKEAARPEDARTENLPPWRRGKPGEEEVRPPAAEKGRLTQAIQPRRDAPWAKTKDVEAAPTGSLTGSLTSVGAMRPAWMNKKEEDASAKVGDRSVWSEQKYGRGLFLQAKQKILKIKAYEVPEEMMTMTTGVRPKYKPEKKEKDEDEDEEERKTKKKGQGTSKDADAEEPRRERLASSTSVEEEARDAEATLPPAPLQSPSNGSSLYEHLPGDSKDIMKLKKKLREIQKIEDSMAAGDAVEPNQKEKVTKKEAYLEELRLLESIARSPVAGAGEMSL